MRSHARKRARRQTESRCIEIFTVLKILIAIVIFGFLIFIHEFGHYIFARIFKVGIYEFAIGMGPKVISRVSKKTGIRYSLRLLPIGGFVGMVGEDEESDDENALNRKPVWQRMIITAAGSFTNIIIGIIVMSITVATSVQLGTTIVSDFTSEDASSYVSGLRADDEIVQIERVKVHTMYQLLYEVMYQGDEPVDVTVIRNGEKIILENVKFPTTDEDGIVMGTYDFTVKAARKTLGSVIKNAFYQSTTSIKLIWQSLFDLIGGKYGIDQVSGPVGVTGAIGDAVEAGSYNVMYLVALFALNLGIFNLLPIPALDGGRLVFQVIELIRRKPISPKVEGYIHFVGIVLLMLLMVVITYKDIVKLITG